MKITLYSLLAALVTVSFAAVDVEKTVKQVQKILSANQGLPRLTRNEIIQLLNDIRSEDAKSSGPNESKEDLKKDKQISTYSTIENEIEPQEINIQNDKLFNDIDVSSTLKNIVETTTKSEPRLTVVLPYTPRDGSSLQELYTRPPRVEVVQISSTTPRPKIVKPAKHIPVQDLKDDTKLSPELLDNFPAELQAFLDAHGLKGKPGQDHFLLPLEGFKPLPPARVIDGSVELPEKLLLTYDLISPSNNFKTNNDGTNSLSSANFLYEPLRPELPFELDTSSSETKEISVPYDMPVRKTKSLQTPNYNPIDYDSVKVIPLSTGVNPASEEVKHSNEQTKRQASTEELTTESVETTSAATTITTSEEPKTNAVTDSASADTDAGPSIADLEDSFGGAAPSQPGDSSLPPPKKNGFYWMLDWNSFLEVGDGDTKVNIRFEPKLGDPQMFLPVTVP